MRFSNEVFIMAKKAKIKNHGKMDFTIPGWKIGDPSLKLPDFPKKKK